MTTQNGRLPVTLTLWLKSWITKEGLSTNYRLELLVGDGSNRSFYRLAFGDAKEDNTYIILSDPSWTLSKDYPPHQLFLQQHGIPVPEFFDFNAKAGCLVMADLGDELLQQRILTQPARREFWLQASVKLLAKLHGETFPVPTNLPVAQRRFDSQKYIAELLFTSEHLREKVLGLSPYSVGELGAVQNYCEMLEKISVDAFSHRDFHTRNLLIKNDTLWMIDFQDARLGPVHYDLASLLYDAYVPTSPSEREELIALYRKEISAFPLGKQLNWDSFENELSCIAFQRVVKAAGSFASFFTRYGKKTHLPYLQPALRSALELQNRTPALGGVLKPVFPIADWIQRVQDWEEKQA